MKHSIFFTAVFCLLFTNCMDDKGGNDFLSNQPDVVMTIPSDAYSTSLGSTITITPNVNSDIAEDDLEFIWEALGEGTNEFDNKVYKHWWLIAFKAKCLAIRDIWMTI